MSPPAQERIFVSHSHKDNTYCRAFVEALRTRHGFVVWYDEHSEGYDLLHTTIDREMNKSQHFVAIFSQDAVTSDWVNLEIAAALVLKKRGVLRSMIFVTAQTCEVPAILAGFRRIEGPHGAGVPPEEAAGRVAHAIAQERGAPIVLPPQRTPTVSPTPPSLQRTASVSPVLPPLQRTTSVPPAPLKHTTSVSPTPPPAPPPAPVAAARRPVRVLPPDRFPERLEQLGFAAHADRGVPYILPPVCPVAAGRFRMGSDPSVDSEAERNEQPFHWVELPAYEIARTPVTVAEYACFVTDGHAKPSNWQQQLGNLDHPVVRVSWNDAVAYATWLARRSNQPWRLPSEAQWEKAARWDATHEHARIYPWGDYFDPARCNTREGGQSGTTYVGGHIRGSADGLSPYTVEDMAGNVWEWTASILERYPYIPNRSREPAQSTQDRVVRGGSWFGVSLLARAACRRAVHPGALLVDDLGFRLLRAPLTR